jgi:hypothetical protein
MLTKLDAALGSSNKEPNPVGVRTPNQGEVIA